MRKKLPSVVAIVVLATSLLAACGDNTATTAPAATTAAATTAAATTAAATTAAATTAAATTAAATTAAATTAAATTAAATTAASGGSATAPNLSVLPTLAPATGKTGGKFTTISLAAELAPVFHPYPSGNDYQQSVIEEDALIWDGALVEYDYTNLKWNLRYAKDMKVSSDGKTFTFTLRDGVKWSDGSPTTVADYQYAFDNASKEDKANPENNFVGLEDLQKMTLKTDDTAQTLTFTFNDVYATDLALSYINEVVPVPSKVWQGKPWYDVTKNSEIAKPTVVNGPYMIESHDPKSQTVFKVNPNWWRGKPNIDQVVYKGGSPSTVIEAIKTGQADYTDSFPPAQYAAAKQDPNVSVYDWSAVNGTYRDIEYNLRKAPLNDKVFRQALNYATDRDTLIKLAENGLGTPQFSFVNPQSPYYNKEVAEYKYNLDTAKKMLADAGYKLDNGKLLGKDGKPITLTVVFPTSSNPRKLTAAYMQQQFQQIGITVNVDGKEFNAYLDQVVKKHDFDIALGAYGGGFPDPDSFKSAVITNGTQNNTGYSNPRVDELFAQGAKELDPTKRKAIYDEVQKILIDDAPVYFEYNLNSFNGFSKRVQGVEPGYKGAEHAFTNDLLTRWSVNS
ncbi:MAG TPA: ABC transporter substrate-binding protein [Chloroflexia bacterium]|nr:ABC transporter substrate-binding protein [Chloroflexia bacterium]